MYNQRARTRAGTVHSNVSPVRVSQVFFMGRKSGLGDLHLFSSDSVRAWQGARAHPGAGCGPRVSAAAQGPSDAPPPVRTLQAAQGTGIPSVSRPGGHLRGPSVPPRDGWSSPWTAQALLSTSGPCCPARHCVCYRCALSAGTGHLFLLLLRAQEPMVRAWVVAKRGGQHFPSVARAVRSAGPSASVLTGLPGPVGPADTQ